MAKKRGYITRRLHRIRRHDFLARMRTHGGQRVIRARRLKGRKRLAITL